jgi:2-desacetyl-2-hydroxyethyl bacteriochlorophyllide A dehydrogenase
MKAFVLRDFQQEMKIENVPDPVPGPLDIILRVRACGVCGTDLKIVSGKIPPPIVNLPHTPGHEIAGEVVAVGSAVRELSPGQKGVVYPYLGCGSCEMCRTERENICLSVKRLGFELPGGFAELVRLPAYNFCSFEANLSLVEMAIVPDAVATSYHALKTLANVRAGQEVLIMGVGGLGIHGVQIAKRMGAKVTAADRREGSLKLARDFGADVTVDVSEESLQKTAFERTGGKGFDVIIENVGSSQSLQETLPCLKRGGRMILVGYDPCAPYPLQTMQMHYNEWTLSGARLSTKRELLEVIDLVEKGKIKPVVSRRIPWQKANEAIREIEQGSTVGRTVLVWGQGCG